MKYFLLAGLFLAASFCVAQQTKPYLINVGTVSPDAASLGKFGNIPVNYSTGIPSITVPLYEISIGKVKVPISIDYHAGGIRVDEVASCVGLGWALNCGGTISRNVMGLPDEQGSTGMLYAPDFATVAAQPENYRQYITDVVDGQRDALQDQFSYSLPDQNGKFTFNQDASVFQFPVTTNKIERYYNNGQLSFKITDDKGTVYLFERPEQYNPGSVNNQQALSYYNVWHLTQIIVPAMGETIDFNYEPTCGNLSFEAIASGMYRLGTQAVCDVNPNDDYPDDPGLIDEDEASEVHQHNSFTPWYLSSITWRGGKITFTNVCDRLDRTSEMRISEITVYADDKNVQTQIRKIKFDHSYFTSSQGTTYNYFATAEQQAKYRLRLDAVEFLSTDASDQPQKYTMEYDNTEMAARETYAQDVWGFNNGQWANTSLLARQLIKGWTNKSGIYNDTYRYIGTANRDVNPLYMKAATLKTLQYPTGGKTEFELEPHQYTTNQQSVSSQTASCGAYGGMNESATTTFTVQSNWSNFRYSCFFSKFNYSGVTDRPRGKITDVTTGQVILNVSSNTDASQTASCGITPLSLIPGHTYSIFVEIYTTTASAVSASLDVTYDVTSNTIQTNLGGGLRIKSIKNYDNTGDLISQDTYTYGENENGIGVLSIPYTFFSMNEEDIITRADCPNAGYHCRYIIGNITKEFHAASLYPASQIAGSPVLYTSVTKYQLDFSGGKTNGKSVYEYDVTQDVEGVPGPDIDKTGMRMISNSWRNGRLKKESVYRSTQSGGYILKAVKQYDYVLSRIASQNSLKIKGKYVEAEGNRCQPLSTLTGEVYVSSYTIETGAYLLQTTTNTSYDDKGAPFITTENFVYADPAHLFPTSTATSSSKGEALTTNMQYAHDLSAPGNVYEKMVNRNIISQPVTTQEQLNSDQQSFTSSHFNDWFGDSKLLVPDKVDLQISTYPAQTKVRFNRFDNYGNILQQQKENDVYQSYIWDYQSVYPVAQCNNADYNSIAYTSFEADGAGNWTIGNNARNTGGITGKNCYDLSNGISKTGLTSGTTYIVSYWTTNSTPFGITGTQGTVLQGKKIGNWTYFEHKVSGVIALTLQQTGLIDELRLYPADAQMVTYSYAPLVGVTSACSAQSMITYYEYDGMGRLKLIKDQDGNVIKTYEYHYKQ
ncbi:hypothetical protein A3860_36400 [Niastella vici]|uniref:YD repeat-containing protein n=1 Tax=Niastella vici TaxID=1703345 RepID=A0A1V9FMS2_9BACT|nr:hypothetical protein [Niastella vici]OQP59654.1 hypothetical protein A3860_36400 [Niastella vici]